MVQARDRKKSLFPESQQVPSDSFFDYTVNGVNYKVSFANLLTALGATGTIAQDGDPTGTPVLDQQGSANLIRNIEDGSGIYTEISPQNGLTIKHNFTADASGIPVLINTTDPSPKIRSIVAGAGIAVTGLNGAVKISATSAPVSTRTVVVNSLADFPEAVAGVITLAANTQYFIFNNIALGTTRIVMADNTVIEGADSQVITLSYSGTGDMFTASAASVRFGRITLSAPSGRILNFFDASGTKNAYFVDGVFNAADIANINGAKSVIFLDSSAAFTSSGFTVSGAIAGSVAFIPNRWEDTSGYVLDISGASSIKSLTMNTSLTYLLSGSAGFIKGVGDTNIDSIATVINQRIVNSGGTVLNGVSIDNVKWYFVGNDGTIDTNPTGLVCLSGNATATTIAVMGTPVKVAGTWAVEEGSFFTPDTTGKVTYNGVRSYPANITVNLSFIFAAGGTQNISVYLYKGGVQIAASRIRSSGTSSNYTSISTTWHQHLANGEYIEVYVANDSGTNNIVVSDAVLRIT